MNSFECYDCGLEFVAEAATSCPQCGGIQISGGAEIVEPGANGEAEIGEKSLPAVREVLRGLCEWDQMLDKALEELSPYLKAA